MPPPASHRLALLLAPAHVAEGDASPGETPWAAEVSAWLRTEGFLTGERPGPRALVEGGFESARVELHDRVRLIANRQGGFRVRCPVDGASVVQAFNRAIMAWRRGGPRSLACGCGRTHDLAALEYSPPVVYARSLIVVREPATAELTAAAHAALTERFGAVRVGLQRG